MLVLPVFGLIMLIYGTMVDRSPKGKLNHWLPPDLLSSTIIVPVVLLAGVALFRCIKFGPLPLFDLSNGSGNAAPLLQIDAFAAFFGLLAVIGTFVTILMSLDYFVDKTLHRSEYFSLLFFATTAIMLVASSTDLLMIYLSIEFLSLCSYVLAAYWKNDEKSSEAGIKYFLFGALSSAVMLYGMSIIYGLTGSTNLAHIASALSNGTVIPTKTAFGAVIMVIAGLGYKLSLVPFHFWAPDTYEGAPTPITAWLSVASKAAGIAVVTRFLLVAIPHDSGIDWYRLLIVLSAASMVIGNLLAIPQKNIKRMLAYSSIAQVGYMMVGLLAAATAQSSVQASIWGDLTVKGSSNFGLPGLMIYAASYLIMNLGAFAVVIAVERKTGRSELMDFSGLSKRAPFLAAAMVVFMLSLAGVPPTAGFLGKFYVFAGAIQSAKPELFIIALIGIANSVISVYYYFNVVRHMYILEPDTKAPVTAPISMRIAVLVMLILTIGILVAAQPMWMLVKAAL